MAPNRRIYTTTLFGGELSINCSDSAELAPNTPFLGADHSLLRTMASETVDPID